MGYNSKKIRAVAKSFYCRSRANFSEGVYQNASERNQNWESYIQKET